MKKGLFYGSGTALVTPFDKEGEIDLGALADLVEFQIEKGTDAIIACGTTGEPSTMTDKEWYDTVGFIVERVNHRVPVIAGTGGNNTKKVIESALAAKELGADAQLCVTPYYNKASQEGLYCHYTCIAEGSSLPLIVYNVPSRTGMRISLETVERLKDVRLVIGIKEASGDASFAADIINACGEDMPLYSGADELAVQLRAVGSLGTISVLANILPEESHLINTLPILEAGKLQLKYMPIIRALFREVNPIPVKAALSYMGKCENMLRLPLTPASEECAKVLKTEMKKAGVI